MNTDEHRVIISILYTDLHIKCVADIFGHLFVNVGPCIIWHFSGCAQRMALFFVAEPIEPTKNPMRPNDLGLGNAQRGMMK